MVIDHFPFHNRFPVGQLVLSPPPLLKKINYTAIPMPIARSTTEPINIGFLYGRNDSNIYNIREEMIKVEINHVKNIPKNFYNF
jgi:hypothetical protein